MLAAVLKNYNELVLEDLPTPEPGPGEVLVRIRACGFCATDFKAMNRVQLGEAPQLLKVSEGGEFKRGTISESKESYRIETYGRVVAITRQVLINDDLDAFTRIPAMYGTAIATLPST